MATTRDAVVSHVAAPAAKVVYDTVLYSFAQDGSATILTRADLDAVHAAMHVNAMSTENNGTTQDTETTTVADDAIDDALVSIDEGECEEACPLVFGEPEPLNRRSQPKRKKQKLHSRLRPCPRRKWISPWATPRASVPPRTAPTTSSA